MPRTKGAKDSKERKQKKKLHLTSKQLYAKAAKYNQLADAEKRSEDKKINAFFPQSKAQNVLDDASIISGSSGSDSDDNDETNDANNSSSNIMMIGNKDADNSDREQSIAFARQRSGLDLVRESIIADLEPEEDDYREEQKGIMQMFIGKIHNRLQYEFSERKELVDNWLKNHLKQLLMQLSVSTNKSLQAV